MQTSPQVKREPKRNLTLGRGSIAGWALASIIAGTYFGTNLVNTDTDAVGLVLENHAVALRETESVFATGATTNTLFLATPFSSGTNLGYKTGTSSTIMVMIEVVANPTGAIFECVAQVAANSGTGGGVALFPSFSATGTTMKAMSGTILGVVKGYACNTRDRIKSTTKLRASGLFLRSSVEN